MADLAEELLGPMRAEIDAIDDGIVALLARRQAIVHRVAAVKEANAIPVVLPERIRAVINRNAACGAAEGLDPDFVRRLYRLIIDEACALEDRLTK